MKILIISNLYPPHHIGGYEIGCRDVTNLLLERGHEIRVLTSRYLRENAEDVKDAPHIFRQLYHGFENYSRWNILMVPFREWRNRRRWKSHLEYFKPDLVYFWNMAQISLWMMIDAASRQIPHACYVSDQWLEAPGEVDFWTKRFGNHHGFASRLLLGLVRGMGQMLGFAASLKLQQLPELHFTSSFIEKGVARRHLISPSSEVIRWGVHSDFTDDLNTPPDTEDASFDILYSGQIVALKGVKTAVKGVADLMTRFPDRQIRLTLAGGGPENFRSEIENLIQELGVHGSIRLVGPQPRSKLLKLFRTSDVFVLASEWQEPFAISPLEAMASGCAVVGTHTGGSPELLFQGINSLVFEAGNPSDLADKLELLLTDSLLLERIRHAGFHYVRKHHRLEDMVSYIERKLVQLVSGDFTAPVPVRHP